MSDDEAREDIEQLEESEGRPPSEESAGEDLMENQEDDYRAIE